METSTNNSLVLDSIVNVNNRLQVKDNDESRNTFSIRQILKGIRQVVGHVINNK